VKFKTRSCEIWPEPLKTLCGPLNFCTNPRHWAYVLSFQAFTPLSHCHRIVSPSVPLRGVGWGNAFFSKMQIMYRITFLPHDAL